MSGQQAIVDSHWATGQRGDPAKARQSDSAKKLAGSTSLSGL